MPRVALVNPAQPGSYSQAPLGLALLAAVIEKAGHPVSVIDANALSLNAEGVAAKVGEAEVVGITAMTPTINQAIAISRQVRKANPSAKIVLGGAHATLLPEETLSAAPDVDFILRGEAEVTLLDLLGGVPPEKVAGLTYRKDGRVVGNASRAELTDLDSLPFLAYHLLPWQKYRPHPPHGRYPPFAAIITSRGCPYHCSYCSKPIFGNRFRAQSPGRVADEIAYHQQRFGVREFAFYDDVFTLDKKRAHGICDEIIRRGLKLRWSCETRVNLVDGDLLKHVKRAGCYSVAYGIESGSQEVLNALDKGITLEQVEAAVRLTRQAGIESVGYFMVGSPGETVETIRQTIALAKKLKLDFAQFAVTTPFPRTRLYELYLAAGRGSGFTWESFVYIGGANKESPVFESEHLDRAAIQHWAKRAHREFYLRPSYVCQRLGRVRSIEDARVNTEGLVMLLRNFGKG